MKQIPAVFQERSQLQRLLTTVYATVVYASQKMQCSPPRNNSNHYDQLDRDLYTWFKGTAVYQHNSICQLIISLLLSVRLRFYSHLESSLSPSVGRKPLQLSSIPSPSFYAPSNK